MVENNLFRYVQFPPGVHACERRRAVYVIAGMSFFDEEWCCGPCLEDEKLLPSYTAARADAAGRSGRDPTVARRAVLGRGRGSHRICLQRASLRRASRRGARPDLRHARGLPGAPIPLVATRDVLGEGGDVGALRT